MSIGITPVINTREVTFTVGENGGGGGGFNCGLTSNGGQLVGKGIAINKDDAEAQMKKSMQSFYSMWSSL